MKKIKIASIFMIFIIIFNIYGCSSKSKNNTKQKEIRICTDIEDRDTVYLLNYIKNEYEKNNSLCKINISTAVDFNEMIDGFTKNNFDIALTHRNNMIELNRKGLIADMSKIIEDNKIEERYYDILTYCGTDQNKNYGIGIVPSPIEIVYNKKVLEKMKIEEPKNIEKFYELVKKINLKGVKIPVIIPEDLDIYNVLFSTIFNNAYYINNIEEFYDSKEKYYMVSNEIEKIFKYTQLLYSNNILKDNTFERISSEQLQELNTNEIPIMVVTFNKKQLLKSQELKEFTILDLKDNFKNVILADPIVSISNSSLDKDEVKSFIKFIYSDEFQKKLCEQGFYTANIKLNKDFSSNYDKDILKHIAYANKRNLYLSYNIPRKLSKNIKMEMREILKGNYKGVGWKNIIKKAYKE